MVSMAFLRKLCQQCQGAELEEIEVYYRYSESVCMNVQEAIESISLSKDEGINISANYLGYRGETYIEKLNDASIQMAIAMLKETAPVNKQPSLETDFIKHIRKNKEIQNIPNETVIKYLKDTYQRLIRSDEWIKSVPVCSFQKNYTQIALINSKGQALSEDYQYIESKISVIAEKDGIMKDGFAYSVVNDYKDMDFDHLAQKALKEAKSMIAAAPLKTDVYPVILQNNVVADLFACMLPVFYEESVEKGISQLGDKIGTSVATSFFSMVEDPCYSEGPNRRTFDDKGVATAKTYLIEKGVMRNILTDTGDKSSCGHTYRNGYRSRPTVSALNGYIEKGYTTTDEMVERMAVCFLITKIDGLHAGINVVNGDFSLSANGYYYQQGKRIQAVDQVTVSGNFYEMLQQIRSISSDVGTSFIEQIFFEAPSLGVGELMIGGL